jgi:hypothetical protein
MKKLLFVTLLVVTGALWAAILTLSFDDPNCASWVQTGTTFTCSSGTTTTTTTTSSTTSTTLPSGAKTLNFVPPLSSGTYGQSERLLTTGVRNQTVIGIFNTGSNGGGGNMGTLAWGPVGGYSQQNRVLVLSATPGLVDPKSPLALSSAGGSNGSLYFFVGTTYAGYATLQPNTTYYLNEAPVGACPSGYTCDVFMEFSQP